MGLLPQWARCSLYRFCEQRETVIPLLAAVLLLFAAGLKYLHLATTPLMPDESRWQHWVWIAQIIVELFWGIWLLVGVYSKFTWLATGLLFALFGISSAYHAVLGHDSCGCFGVAKVNPLLMLIFDALVAGAFLSLRLTTKGGRDRASLKRGRFVGVLFTWLLLAVPVVIFSSGPQLSTVSDNGEIADDAAVVLLDPQQWAGKQFALAKHMDVGSIFARGHWHLVFVRPGCSYCEEALKELVSASSPTSGDDDSRWAIVVVPTLTEEASGLVLPPHTHILLTRLANAKTWLAKVPFTITVVDGIVMKWVPGVPRRS